MEKTFENPIRNINAIVFTICSFITNNEGIRFLSWLCVCGIFNNATENYFEPIENWPAIL